MPQLTIYHLTFPHGLHIGAGGVESVEDSRESVPSDTLFAALLDTAVHLGWDVSKQLLPANDSPALRVTSAFPFAGGVRFYPKPVDLRELFSKETLEAEGAGKRLKKIRYISEGLLRKAAGGAYLGDYLFPEDETEDPENGLALQGGAFWLLPEEVDALPPAWRLPKDKWWTLRRKKVYETQTAPRVTVDRVNAAPNLFQSERVTFTEGCGLWFGGAGLPQKTKEQDKTWFENLLTVLGDSGLGGERSVGYGHFQWKPAGEISFDDLQTCATDARAMQLVRDEISFDDSKTCAYLLSRWHPKDKNEIAMLQNTGSAYKLEAVEGWLRTSENAAAQRRKRLWMVAEGSLIAGKPQGDAVNVKPEYDAKSGETIPHPVYRPGFALALDWEKTKH